jgi:hypothetical protein
MEWACPTLWPRPIAPPSDHLVAAVLQHHVHVVPVSEVSVEGHNVSVPKSAVQGNLMLHLWAPPHTYGARRCRQGCPTGAPQHSVPLHAPCTHSRKERQGLPVIMLQDEGHTFLRGRRCPASPPPHGTTLSANTALVDMSVSL